ncbi:MAG: LptF/LptG family permease, partial [Pseudomonadota bacterium]
MGLTLGLYIARNFLIRVVAVLGVVASLIMIGELIEIGRGLSGREIGALQVATLVVLHMPSILNKTFPFVFLLAAMAAFLQLARSSELVVTRAAGVSAWRLLAPVVLSAALLGVFAFSVFNPIAAATLKRYEAMSAEYFRGQDSLLSVSREGLWLRQAEESGVQTVIRADRASPDGTRLEAVTLFRFDGNGRMTGRIEAERAELRPGLWALIDALEWQLDAETMQEAAAPIARDEIE